MKSIILEYLISSRLSELIYKIAGLKRIDYVSPDMLKEMKLLSELESFYKGKE